MSHAGKNTRAVMYNNRYIFDEVARYGQIKDSSAKFNTPPVFRRKAASPETRAAKAQEKRYTKRSNLCPIHNMTKSLGTNLCPMCEE
jgi:hypothetical protein